MITFYLIGLVTLFIFIITVITFGIILDKELKEYNKRFNKEIREMHKQVLKRTIEKQKSE